MKKRELKEIRNQNIADLEKKLSELKRLILTNSTNMWAGKETDLKGLRSAKRDIAQISTIISERAENQEKQTKNK